MDNTVELSVSTEEKILDAARKTFLQKGFGGSRMQQIADEAGINKALLHYYFRSKDQLFEVILDEALGQLWPALGSLFASNKPFAEKITGFVDLYVEMALKQPYIPLFVINEAQSNPQRLQQRMAQYHPPVQEIFSAIQLASGKGEIRAANPAHTLLNMLSLLVFPFMARPLLTQFLNIDNAAFDQLIIERKKEIIRLLLRDLQPQEQA